MRTTGRTALLALVPMFAALTLGAVSATPALASGKPTVETKAATSVAEKEATLNGVVNPNGAATTYYFEYYAGKGAWVKTAEASAGSGTSNVEEKAVLSGLKAEEPYHFRVVASNSAGTSTGSTLAFETSAAAGLPEFTKTVNNKKFTLSGGTVTFKNYGGSTYSCSGSKGEGEITGAKTATMTLVFTGCAVSGVQCESEGAEAGEIKTGTLPADLRYTSTENHEVGVVVNYHEEKLAGWSCGTTTGLGIHGSIIAPITALNVGTKTHTLTFAAKAGKEYQQNPTSFEGAEGKVAASPLMALIGSSYEEGSVQDSLTMTSSSLLEVKG